MSPRLIRQAERCPRTLRGAFLLEILVAILVLALTSASVFGLLTIAIQESSNTQWRMKALSIATSALAQMWVENPAMLADRYDATGNGAGYVALLAAAKGLPGVSDAENAPAVSFESAPFVMGQRVLVTVKWQLPHDSSVHHTSISGVIPRP